MIESGYCPPCLPERDEGFEDFGDAGLVGALEMFREGRGV
jgi:hypothetical protein